MNGPWIRDKGSVWHADPFLVHIRELYVKNLVFVSITRCGRLVLYGMSMYGNLLDSMSWSEAEDYVASNLCEVCGALDQ